MKYIVFINITTITTEHVWSFWIKSIVWVIFEVLGHANLIQQDD